MFQGLRFWKLTGSGNDFVFFDARRGFERELLDAPVIGAICDRRSGVGADGIVLFEPPVERDELYSIRYFNRDGTLAEMCGNAALCSVRLADLLGALESTEGKRFLFHSSSGPLSGRLESAGSDPEISMPVPAGLKATYEIALDSGEQRIGFARIGVPHLVVLVNDLEALDVVSRGRALRMDKSLRDGANVNFVRQLGPRHWAMRTYERGVEAETLACGSGAVAVATLAAAWALEPPGGDVTILARGGRELGVSWAGVGHNDALQPFLRGEGRLVFAGELADVGAHSAMEAP